MEVTQLKVNKHILQVSYYVNKLQSKNTPLKLMLLISSGNSTNRIEDKT